MYKFSRSKNTFTRFRGGGILTVNEKGNLVFNGEELRQDLSIIENNISSIQTELKSKTSQTNTVIGYLDYANAVSVSKTSNSTTSKTYTAPANGMFMINILQDQPGQLKIGKITLTIGTSTYTRPMFACLPLKKGDVVTYICTGSVYFVKSKY